MNVRPLTPPPPYMATPPGYGSTNPARPRPPRLDVDALEAGRRGRQVYTPEPVGKAELAGIATGWLCCCAGLLYWVLRR